MNKGPSDTPSCKFNFGVICPISKRENCDICGWNPQEAEARRYRIRKIGTARPTRMNYLAHVNGEETQTVCRSWTGLKRGY